MQLDEIDKFIASITQTWNNWEVEVKKLQQTYQFHQVATRLSKSGLLQLVICWNNLQQQVCWQLAKNLQLLEEFAAICLQTGFDLLIFGWVPVWNICTSQEIQTLKTAILIPYLVFIGRWWAWISISKPRNYPFAGFVFLQFAFENSMCCSAGNLGWARQFCQEYLLVLFQLVGHFAFGAELLPCWSTFLQQFKCWVWFDLQSVINVGLVRVPHLVWEKLDVLRLVCENVWSVQPKLSKLILDSSIGSKLFLPEIQSKDHLSLIHCYYCSKPELN